MYAFARMSTKFADITIIMASCGKGLDQRNCNQINDNNNKLLIV